MNTIVRVLTAVFGFACLVVSMKLLKIMVAVGFILSL